VLDAMSRHMRCQFGFNIAGRKWHPSNAKSTEMFFGLLEHDVLTADNGTGLPIWTYPAAMSFLPPAWLDSCR